MRLIGLFEEYSSYCVSDWFVWGNIPHTGNTLTLGFVGIIFHAAWNFIRMTYLFVIYVA